MIFLLKLFSSVSQIKKPIVNAKKRPKIAVSVENFIIKKNNHNPKTKQNILLAHFFMAKKRIRRSDNESSAEYLRWDMKMDASLIVPEVFFVGSKSILTK